jgi:SAM-dependent methyltransferase
MTASTPLDDTTEPHALGTPPSAYLSVLEILTNTGAKKVLDCAAGQGAFARKLLDRHFEPKCCDVYPDDFKLQDIPCEYANLNDRIPFDRDQFDALTCLNALQRIWARGRALSEMARVIKPGGHLVLTMFNNNNLMRRAMFLVSGSIVFDTCGPPFAFEPDAPNPEAQFRYPMPISCFGIVLSS